MVSSVRTRRAFSALSGSRNRARSGPVWVVRADAPRDAQCRDAPCRDAQCRAPEPDQAHVAYAVSKAVGGAVVRNRVRRRLRALMTDLERNDDLPPGLYLVGATPAAVDESFSDLRRHLCGALSRMAVADR